QDHSAASDLPALVIFLPEATADVALRKRSAITLAIQLFSEGQESYGEHTSSQMIDGQHD
ncbi:hypothetical protein RMSM_07750, partial [Rhodopirellula maiorica SM1]